MNWSEGRKSLKIISYFGHHLACGRCQLFRNSRGLLLSMSGSKLLLFYRAGDMFKLVENVHMYLLSRYMKENIRFRLSQRQQHFVFTTADAMSQMLYHIHIVLSLNIS